MRSGECRDQLQIRDGSGWFGFPGQDVDTPRDAEDRSDSDQRDRPASPHTRDWSGSLVARLRLPTARVEPRIELALVRKHRPEHSMLVAVNRKPFVLFPAVDGSNATLPVGRNVLPRVTPLAR